MSALKLHLPPSSKQLNLSLYNCIFGPLRTKAKAKVKSQLGDGSGYDCWVASALLIAARKLSALISLKFVRQKTPSREKERQRRQHKQGNKQKCRLDCVVDGPSPSPYAGSVLPPPPNIHYLPCFFFCRTGSKDSIESDTIVRTDCRRVATAATWSLNPQRIRKV